MKKIMIALALALSVGIAAYGFTSASSNALAKDTQDDTAVQSL